MSVGRQFEKNYRAVLGAVINGLEAQHISYMIVGGLAAAYHGIPRATFDVDLVVAIDGKNLEPLVRTLRRLGFDLRLTLAKELLRIGNCIPTWRPKGPRLDIWLMRSDYDRVAFARRQRVGLWPGQQAWVASVEDLVLSKLIAGRTRDLEDVIGVLEVQRKRLDWTYLQPWAKRLELTKQLARVKAKRV